MAFRPLNMSDYQKRDGSKSGFDHKKSDGPDNPKVSRAKNLLGTNFNEYAVSGIFENLDDEEAEKMLNDLETRLKNAAGAMGEGRICEEWLEEARRKIRE